MSKVYVVVDEFYGTIADVTLLGIEMDYRMHMCEGMTELDTPLRYTGHAS